MSERATEGTHTRIAETGIDHATVARLPLTSWPVLLVLALALCFYVWTAASSPVKFDFSSSTDIYNLLTTGFLHGHTYLPIRPPAGLLQLANPYDPAQNAPYNAAFHDFSLYNGRFYSSWGPTPALTLFLLFRLTTLKMSQSFAVALFSFAGLACAIALLHLLVRHLVPKTPRWLLTVASAGLALTNVAPFILRRPAQYEVAIGSGYCFEMAGILLIVSAVLAATPSSRRLALGSLCLGLAIGSRPDLLAGGAAALAGALYLIYWRKQRRGVLVAALTPLFICGLLLASYNYARFGSIAENGQHYQLASFDVTIKRAEQLAYVPPGLFTYLLVPPRLALTFPHVFLMDERQYPLSLPRGYDGSPGGWSPEQAGGVLPTMPIVLLVLMLPAVWWRARRSERPALIIATGFTCLALAIAGLLSWALWGTTQRYEVDFATLFLIPAFLLWAMLLARYAGRKRLRRGVAVAGITLTAFGAVVGTAVSVTGPFDWTSLLASHPGVFRTLEDATSPLATLASMEVGKPVVVRVSGPLPVVRPRPGYGTLGEDGAATWLGAGPVTVTVVAPHAQTMTLRTIATPNPQTPASASLKLAVRSDLGTLEASVHAGYMYPPIRLHRGLNRVELNLLSRSATFPGELYLGDITLKAPGAGAAGP